MKAYPKTHSPPPDPGKNGMVIHYTRTPDFRVVYSDGFIGNWNGSRHLCLSSFTELPRLPTVQVEHPELRVDDQEQLIDVYGVSDAEGRLHLERLVGAQMILDAGRVRELRDFLSLKLLEMDRILGRAPKAPKND